MLCSILIASLLSTPATPHALTPRGPPPLELDFSSQLDERATRVRRALLNFNPPATLAAHQPPSSSPIDIYEKQTLRGLSGPFADNASLSAGVALFATFSILAARAPGPARALFTGPTNLGPAILRDGGFGAGLGHRW